MNTTENKQQTGNQLLNTHQEQFFLAQGLSNLLLRPPLRLVHPYTWAGHLPFAQALVRLMWPHVIVELGTHTGNSFCAFCQAVVQNGLDTRCYAVDTWSGDTQAGYYDEAVYKELVPYVQATYGDFASLLRMTFDEALTSFEDGSIDLLHIDGLHTYEAVRHDFDAWKPKLSSRSVVLLHDTRVFDRDFGVHRLWAELQQEYPSFEFLHSHGLGVLLVGSEVASAMSEFIGLAVEDSRPIQSLFECASRVWLPNEAIAYQRRFGSEPVLSADRESLDCELYIDRGQGFNNAEKLISCMQLENGKGVTHFNLERFGGLVGLRFDPGNEAITLRRLDARGRKLGGSWQELEVISNTAIHCEREVLLFAADPWIEFAIPAGGVDSIEIELQVDAMGATLVDMLAKRVERGAGLEAQLKAHEVAAEKLWADLEEKDRIIARLSEETGRSALLETQLKAHEVAAEKLWADLEEKDRIIARLSEKTGQLDLLEAKTNGACDKNRETQG